MSADGKACECGKAAVASLRVGGVPEPICAACLDRIAPGASEPPWPIVEMEGYHG